MNIEFVPELQITKSTSSAISELLARSFPDFAGEYDGRAYFKQLPHYRLLAYEDQRLIGHLSIDLRVMNLNGQAVTVFGAIDFCVSPDRQGSGIGSELLRKFETVARDSNRVDFLFLVADNPAIYESMGYQATTVRTKWLKIDQHKNYGVGDELISDAFMMYKAISDTQWKDGELDLLGYMY